MVGFLAPFKKTSVLGRLFQRECTIFDMASSYIRRFDSPSDGGVIHPNSSGYQSSKKFLFEKSCAPSARHWKIFLTRRNNPGQIFCLFDLPSMKGIEKILTPCNHDNPMHWISNFFSVKDVYLNDVKMIFFLR